MPFPSTEQELVEAGYSFSTIKNCKACGASIEWWQTPSGSWMPLDKKTYKPHWGTCPKAKQFRRAKSHGSKRRKNKGSDSQGMLF